MIKCRGEINFYFINTFNDLGQLSSSFLIKTVHYDTTVKIVKDFYGFDPQGLDILTVPVFSPMMFIA